MVRLAGGTGVFELLAMFLTDECDRLISKRVIGVFTDNEHTIGANRHAISAAVALVGVDGDEEIAGAVLVAVVRYHAVYLSCPV